MAVIDPKNTALYGNNGVVSNQQQTNDSYARLNQDASYVDQEINRAMSVRKARSDTGMDTSNQDAYLNTLYQKRDMHASNAQAQKQAAIQAMYGQLQGQANAQYQSQAGAIEKIRSNQLAETKKAYEDAVMQGDMSVREAQQAFEAQTAQINQQSYLDSERTALYGNEMGIQNSQQMLGLQAGDNARKNQLVNGNMTERDRRVADIKDRVRSITLKKDLDLARINAESDAGLMQARGTADAAMYDKQFQVGFDDFRTTRDQGFQQKMQDRQNGFDLNKLAVGHGYDLENAATQHGYKIDEMNLGHKMDIEKIGIQFQNSLKLEDVQYGHQSALEGQRAANAAAQARANLEAKLKSDQSDYDLAMQREMNKFDANTPEGKIRQAQIKEQRDVSAQKAMDDAKMQAKIEYVKSAPDTPPAPPSNTFWSDLGGLALTGQWGTGYASEADKSAYNDALTRYKAKQQLLGN